MWHLLSDLPPFLREFLLVETHGDKTCIRKPVSETEESNTVGKRRDICLLGRETEVSFSKIVFDDPETFHELLPVVAHDLDIVHITDIDLHVHLFLEDVVELVQNRELNQLRYLTSQTDSPVIARNPMERINEHEDIIAYPWIINTLGNSLFCHPMRSRAEIVLDIDVQYPAVVAVLAPVALQKVFQSFPAIGCAFSYLTGPVIINETLGKGMIKVCIAHGPLYHTIPESRCHNIPWFRFIDMKTGIGGQSVCSVMQRIHEFCAIDESVLVETRHGIFPKDVASAFPDSLDQISIVERNAVHSIDVP